MALLTEANGFLLTESGETILLESDFHGVLSAAQVGSIVTVTLTGGTFDGVESSVTIAPSAGVPTLTSAGTMVNNGDGTWTITPTAGQTNFMYTNSASATIPYTNSPGWDNPTATSYTAITGRLLLKRRRLVA